HAHTNYSLLDGVSDPEAMAEHAAVLGLRALAITDHDTLAGIVRFAVAAKRQRIRAIIGAELTIEPRHPTSTGDHVVLLAETLEGYRNLCRLLTFAYARGGKDAPGIPFDVLATHAEGLIALSGCPRGELPRTLLREGEDAALRVAGRYKEAFRGAFFVELQKHHLQLDGARNAGLRAVAARARLQTVATTNAHYHDAERALLHDVVTCIRHRTTLEEAGTLLRGNHDYALKSPAQMARLFAAEVRHAAADRHPHLDPLRGTLVVAERCAFGLQDLQYEFPRPYVPGGESELSFLIRLVEGGRDLFYPNAGPEVQARLDHELDIVRQLDLAGYLLVFKEVVDWTHRHGIAVSIRGSAPSSALLYCLGLCPIDPLEHNLLFERFCSPQRKEYPDIDLDFAHEKRELVIQHVYEKYGRDHAAMVCETNTYRWKSALRDVAKVLGLSAQRAQQLADQIDWHDEDPAERLLAPSPTPVVKPERMTKNRTGGLLSVGIGSGPRDQARTVAHLAGAPEAEAPAGGPGGEAPGRAVGAKPESLARGSGGAQRPPAPPAGEISGRMALLLLKLARQLLHSPRHRSIHVGGMVISAGPLTNVAPIEPARMPNRTILPWDKDDLSMLAEEFGVNLIKMDLLALGMLSAIGRCFDHVHNTTGQRLNLHGFRYDPRCYQVLSAADTIGLFQVESRAQQSFLPRLKPTNLAETAISVGAIRPGPGAARAGHHIVLRRQGKEQVSYPTPELKEVLKETWGVLLWQEQAIQVAVAVAGYSPGEADQLRRAMSHKRSVEYMDQACAELVDRMVARGHSPTTAESVRKMIVGFAGYGFPRSHAYAFAHLALISASLRLQYPAAYYCALLNCQPMGFYAPHTLLWDAYRHNVPVLPVDVNLSDWECTLEALPGVPPEEPAIRLGFREVAGLGPAARAIIEREHARGPFTSLADFIARTGFNREDLERLAEVGTFLSLESPEDRERRASVWAAGELAGFGHQHLPGLAEQIATKPTLTPFNEWEEVQADYRGLGYSLHRHVISFYRPRLNRLRALSAVQLQTAKRGLIVKAGGLVIVRQRPESAGRVLFLTIEDETGLFNAIVYPNAYERLRQVLRGEPLLVIEGPVQLQDGVVHILVRRAWPLAAAERVAAVPSHDFH
ncbi:MAG TPA: PHP domain-containing protein, partial [Chloroflexota bacterium]|nr:PHP domain-containing protein [Chloroflexota bacterium]